MESVFIVIPTYNERETIKQLLIGIFSLPIQNLHVLVVDDNSPDKTGELVEVLCLVNPNLEVLHRKEKNGLGPAYVAGFRYCLQQGAELIVQMDADLSHDPAAVPTLIAASKSADLVLGSRYINGGRVVNWGVGRRLISRFGNRYARLVLGLPYHDLTGGFKCDRRAILEKIGLDRLSSVGYNFQIETTYFAHRQGARIVEAPITFTERAAGRSKFSLKIIIESFWKVLRLRLDSRHATKNN